MSELLSQQPAAPGVPPAPVVSDAGGTSTPTSGRFIELFLHWEGVRPRPHSALLDETLDSLLRRAGVPLQAASIVFVGECSDSLSVPIDLDDTEDSHESADISKSLEALGISDHCHVHHHRCRRVAVEVNYGRHTKRHRFSPATPIAVATEWAIKRFKLTDTDALTYVLQMCDSTRRPRPDEHLGDLVTAENCGLCFDLIPDKTKVEG